ncbi:MAG: ATP-dependent DNA helicase RecQ [Vulcanimicrobiota bacterium]
MVITQERHDIKNLLQSVFGFDSFRPMQSLIISAILEGRDVFAVMPTGGGKSLCYQLPALAGGGITVIVSPLISLMKDQVEAAQKKGIASAFINSSLTSARRREIYRILRKGRIRLLYAAPERIVLESFLDHLDGLPLSLFAIDEAHCVSQWGNDFRPDYLGLSKIPVRFPEVPLAAFTATATLKVQKDIIERIGFRNPLIVRAPFDRPNLFYAVFPREDQDMQILSLLREERNKQGIIYCGTRKKADETAGFLKREGILALSYHAGLTAEERADCQEAFSQGAVSVIVATVAFGMGIDKPDIRFVIHIDLPNSLERYAQETGRAGRDGEPSLCVLFYSRADIFRHSYFIGKMEDDTRRRIAGEQLDAMVTFAEGNLCRRKELLSYFGEEFRPDCCEWCDICRPDMVRRRKSREALPALFSLLSEYRQPSQGLSCGSGRGSISCDDKEKTVMPPLLSCKRVFDIMVTGIRKSFSSL